MDVDAVDAGFIGDQAGINTFRRGLPFRELCGAMRGERSKNPRFAEIMKEILE